MYLFHGCAPKTKRRLSLLRQRNEGQRAVLRIAIRRRPGENEREGGGRDEHHLIYLEKEIVKVKAKSVTTTKGRLDD